MLDKFLNDELIDIIDNLVCSFVGWELILLLNEHADVRMTNAEIAQKINRPESEVAQTIRIFVEKGLLKKENRVFYYSPDSDLQNKVDIFIDALNQRNTRLAIISELLKKR